LHPREAFIRLAVALAVGLLIGLERGWQEREAQSGTRVAGLRTFALLALLGALWGLLADDAGMAVLALAFIAVALAVTTGHALAALRWSDYGLTTAVAALVTFALGAAAMRGHLALTAAAGVVTATLLGVKSILHGWVARLEQRDLYAILQMLVISVVLLPVLPDRGFGPWAALNPYELWWLVVLIAAVSFSGYFASRILGPSKGLALTALLGGLVSSTAVTLEFARRGRASSDRQGLLAAGILAATGTTFPRVLLVAGVLHLPLVAVLAAPLVAMGLVAWTFAALLWWRERERSHPEEPELRNPFALGTALKFGLLLAAIVLLAEGLRRLFGETGVYMLAAVGGLADVDAVTLSLARVAGRTLDLETAARGIVLVTVVNSVVKGALCAGIARAPLARLVGGRIALVIAAGLAALAL